MELDSLSNLVPLPLRFLAAFFLFGSMAWWDWKKNPSNPTRAKEYAFLILSCLLAILFAEVHDAITMRISPEYFIRGKGLGAERLGWKVAELAVQASYWVGLILGLVFLLANNPYKKFTRLKNRQLLKLTVAPILGALICGPAFGIWFWFSSKELEPSFAFVWGMHNGTYLGAALGAVVGVVLILKKRRITLDSFSGKDGKWLLLDRILLAALFFSLGYELFSFYLPDDWFLDLVSHFRGPRFAMITFLVSTLAIRRSKNTFLAWVAVLAIGLSSVSFIDFYRARGLASQEDALQVISFNVLTENTKTKEALEWLEGNLSTKTPNLVFLMEVNPTWLKEIAPLKRRLPYSLEVPAEHNFGFAVYSDIPLEGAKETVFDESGITAAEGWVSLRGRKTRFIGAHTSPPASEQGFHYRNSFLRNLKLSLKDEPTLIFGDLNSTPWSRPVGALLSKNEVLPEVFLSSADQKFLKSPTWFGLGSLLAIPIDYILFSRHLVSSSFEVGPDLGSDHRPIKAKLKNLKDR